MAIVEESGKYYMKGKIKRINGSYYNYKRIIKGTKSIRKMKDAERLFIEQFKAKDTLSDITFEELAKKYLLSYKRGKESTKITKQQDLKRPIVCFGKENAKDITSKGLQLYINEIEKELSEKYVKKIFYAIKQVFDYGVQEKYVTDNPMKNVVRTIDFDTPKKEMKYWTLEDFDRFCKSPIEHNSYFLLIYFLYKMGCRRGEALALTWDDIDFTNKTVDIKKTMSFKVRPPRSTTPKTKNSYRIITMPDDLIDLLKEHYNKCSNYYGFKTSSLVFGYTKPLDPESIRRYLRNAIKTINTDEDGNLLAVDKQVPDIRLHDLRHSHASYLIRNMNKGNYNDYDIAKRLGDTRETIFNTYAHWFKEKDQGIIDMMNSNDNSSTTLQSDNEITQLRKLKQLYEQGLITEDIYILKQKALLDL